MSSSVRAAPQVLSLARRMPGRAVLAVQVIFGVTLLLMGLMLLVSATGLYERMFKRLLGTAMGLTAFAGAIAPCWIAIQRRVLLQRARMAILVGVGTFFLVVGEDVWERFVDLPIPLNEVAWASALAVLCTAHCCLHALLRPAAAHDHLVRVILTTTHAFSAVLLSWCTACVFIALLTGSHPYDAYRQGWVAAFIGSGIVLMAATACCIGRTSASLDAHDSANWTLNLTCPRCRAAASVPTGYSTCPACRLTLRVDIERPACTQCGYLLTGLTADRCPECGAPVTTRAN